MGSGIYWIGQKVCLDFPSTSYGKTQENFLAKPIQKELAQLNNEKPNNPIKMGKRFRKILHQNIDIDGKKAHERTLNIINYQ